MVDENMYSGQAGNEHDEHYELGDKEVENVSEQHVFEGTQEVPQLHTQTKTPPPPPLTSTASTLSTQTPRIAPKLRKPPVVKKITKNDYSELLRQADEDTFLMETHTPNLPQPSLSLVEVPNSKTTQNVQVMSEEEERKEVLKNRVVSKKLQEMLNRKWQHWTHLDPVVEKVKSVVQQQLLDEGYAEKIVDSLTNEDIKKDMQETVEMLTLAELYNEKLPNDVSKNKIIQSVRDEILGLGPIEPLWNDDSITEVLCNGPEEIWIEQYGRLKKVNGIRFRSRKQLQEVCEKIFLPLNRKLDIKSPLADGRLPDGSRVNGVHVKVSPDGPNLTVRKFPSVNFTLKDLTDIGSLTPDMAQTIAWLIQNKATILVSGGTGTGKTTMLNALSAAIPRDERIITIEDSLELQLDDKAHVVALEAQPEDSSGANSVTIRQLLKNSLRMRPNRILVGEVRDEAALEMLQACNTGHEGSMSTIHANGPDQAVTRLAVMVGQGGDFPADKVNWLVGSAIDIIITLARDKTGPRRIDGVYEVPEVNENEPLKTIPLWKWKRTGTDEGGEPVGEYVVVNKMSKILYEKLQLEWNPKPTWEQIVNNFKD